MVALADKDEVGLEAAVEQVRAKDVAVHDDLLDFAVAPELARRNRQDIPVPSAVPRTRHVQSLAA